MPNYPECMCLRVCVHIDGTSRIERTKASERPTNGERPENTSAANFSAATACPSLNLVPCAKGKEREREKDGTRERTTGIEKPSERRSKRHENPARSLREDVDDDASRRARERERERENIERPTAVIYVNGGSPAIVI